MTRRRGTSARRVDLLGEIEDLVGQAEQPLVLLLLLLDRPPSLVRDHLALLVGAVLADHDECRQEDGFQRHDHGQQSERVVLDAKADPEAEPDDMEVDELHRARPQRDVVGNPVLPALAALAEMPHQRRACRGGRWVTGLHTTGHCNLLRVMPPRAGRQPCLSAAALYGGLGLLTISPTGDYELSSAFASWSAYARA